MNTAEKKGYAKWAAALDLGSVRALWSAHVEIKFLSFVQTTLARYLVVALIGLLVGNCFAAGASDQIKGIEIRELGHAPTLESLPFPPRIDRFWVKGSSPTDDNRYGMCENQRQLLLDFDINASPRSNLVSAELQYTLDSEDGDSVVHRRPLDLIDALSSSELPTRTIDQAYTLRLVVRGHDNEDSRLIHLYFLDDERCASGIDYNGIPWATTVAESKARLSDRQRAVMQYWADKPLDVANWGLPPDLEDSFRLLRTFNDDDIKGKREHNALICFARLWRAYFDPYFSGDRESLVEGVNDHLLNDAVVSYNIGTLEKFTYKLGANGQDYDFVLRVLTKLIYAFKDVTGNSRGVTPAAQNLGPALRPDTKMKLMSDLLTQSGTNHHTVILTEKALEKTLWKICAGTSVVPAAAAVAPILSGSFGFPATFGNPVDPFSIVTTLTACKIASGQFVDGDISETENHILMAESSRFLKNQLLFQRDGDASYDNSGNGFNDWMKRHLQQFLVRGFNEYNSPTYQGYTIAPLANLAEYATSAEVRRLARMALDLISATYAVQSYDLKRVVGFHRKPGDAMQIDLWSDSATGFFSVLFGNYAGLMDNDYSGIWGWGTLHALSSAALQDYAVPDLILDLGIEKGNNPYEVRINHTSGGSLTGNSPHTQNVEILTGRDGYVLSAGGRTSTPNYWYADLLSALDDQHNGWSRPTSLVTRGYQTLTVDAVDRPSKNVADFEDADDPCKEVTCSDHGTCMVVGENVVCNCDSGYFANGLTCHYDHNDFLISTSRESNNTGVFRNMAFGSFAVPDDLSGFVTHARNDWKIVSLQNAGILVAVNETGGVLEVVPDRGHGGLSLDNFRRAVEVQSPSGQYTSALDPTVVVSYYLKFPVFIMPRAA